MEKNKKNFQRNQKILEGEIYDSQKSETEVKERTEKIMGEKNTLENMTSKGGDRLMQPESYKNIKDEVNKIFDIVTNNTKNPGDFEPLPTLIEIEKHVHKLIKMYETA